MSSDACLVLLPRACDGHLGCVTARADGHLGSRGFPARGAEMFLQKLMVTSSQEVFLQDVMVTS
ncbi:hypothetical protein F511_21827 [Dorcoceras hygrometricum]|uniref:Uncharacterized protein n=1 Tax=Dorcoceras hygrometricum TaxID=472368 RepID=A0A2Z7C3K5_9LAMI|nr:hypothetical protein F511_21827 [Dorcoceras hygrometricum]